MTVVKLKQPRSRSSRLIFWASQVPSDNTMPFTLTRSPTTSSPLISVFSSTARGMPPTIQGLRLLTRPTNSKRMGSSSSNNSISSASHVPSARIRPSTLTLSPTSIPSSISVHLAVASSIPFTTQGSRLVTTPTISKGPPPAETRRVTAIEDQVLRDELPGY